ncbi:MAG: hypothetical protein GX801_02470 [Fibrobacter sp.]|nr:hypothetical protein [Fibrobacter sp.]
MKEAFRRAIRKMTGKSINLLPSRPIREDVLGKFATGMSSAWTVILQEHINASLEQEQSYGSGEYVSRSEGAWELAQDLFPALQKEFSQKSCEFRDKWHQRYTLKTLTPQLQQGNWLQKADSGWFFNLGTSEQQIKDFYFETLHLMVGDAEKLLVMHFSRILHIQERLVAEWHQESVNSPLSKVLPSFEAGMRESEIGIFKTFRDGISTIAFRYFSNAFKSESRKKTSFASADAATRQIGSIWNPTGVWETGFLAFLHDFCDYLEGLISHSDEWYYNKWTLFLRGFSAGQLDLFQSPASSLRGKYDS